jgi:hypothetical protein
LKKIYLEKKIFIKINILKKVTAMIVKKFNLKKKFFFIEEKLLRKYKTKVKKKAKIVVLEYVKNIPNKISKFFDKYIDSKESDSLSPHTMLSDEIFNDLKKNKSNLNTSPMQKNINYKRSIKLKEINNYSGTNKLNKKKRNTIENENKISIQKLSEDMTKSNSTLSFLWKGSRNINNSSNDAKSSKKSKGGKLVKKSDTPSQSIKGSRTISNNRPKNITKFKNSDEMKDLDKDANKLLKYFDCLAKQWASIFKALKAAGEDEEEDESEEEEEEEDDD